MWNNFFFLVEREKWKISGVHDSKENREIQRESAIKVKSLRNKSNKNIAN